VAHYKGLTVAEMTDLRALAGHEAPQSRHQSSRSRAAFRGSQRRNFLHSTEGRMFLHSPVEVRSGRRNQLDGVVVARFRALAPTDHAVTGEHHTAQGSVTRDVVPQPQAQIEAGPLPAQPADRPLPDLACSRFTAARGGERDDGVGMHVIDVRERQIRMQRRIDRSRARIQVERAVRQVPHHLVLVFLAAIELFETQELVEVERREAIEPHGTEVAAGALHPQHLHGLACERIALRELRGRVAAAEIRDREIRAQEVGPVQEKLRLGHSLCPILRPAVGGLPERECCATLRGAVLVHESMSASRITGGRVADF